MGSACIVRIPPLSALTQDPLVRGLFDASSTTGALADGAPTVAMTAPAAVSETESDLLAAGAVRKSPWSALCGMLTMHRRTLALSRLASSFFVDDTSA